MKKKLFATITLVALTAICSTGCSTPAYSASERGSIIARNMSLEWKMAQDDIDHALLLRPNTQLTNWHVRGIGE
ncbi:MAG TPA: hypothetical protein PK402_11275 [Tepidisphaeraceae bacterium]|nr:hypothetical protein [Tepidisphaeraceae bacterium]